MLKLITYPGQDEYDNVFVEKIDPGAELTKTASELHEEIAAFIRSLRPDPNKLYVLINAMGAGEYYSSNANGDYFEESQLLGIADKYKDLEVKGRPFGHKTFLSGGVFRHHKNKDMNKSMGKVVVSVYNPKMHRVELVVCIDRDKAEQLGHGDIVRALDEGKHPSVSMGAKVPLDICSVCGHRSKTRADYCTHARHMMGQILPNGVKVCVYNPLPKFFDISFVLVGADKTSFAMHKVASVESKLSADAAAEAGLIDPDELSEKQAKKNKLSEILKKVPMTAEKIVPKATRKEFIMPKIILKQASELPLESALTTFSSMGIVLKPEEFQYIVLNKLGHSVSADNMYDQGKVFTQVDRVDKSVPFGKATEFSEKLASQAVDYMENRSSFEPFISKRVLTDPGNTSNIPTRSFTDSGTLKKISAAYNGYRAHLLSSILNITEDITLKQPIIKTALAKETLEDEFIFGGKKASMPLGLAVPILGMLPLAHLYGAYVRRKTESGQDVSVAESFVAKHPNLAASLAMGLARFGIALKKGGAFSDPGGFANDLFRQMSS